MNYTQQQLKAINEQNIALDKLLNLYDKGHRELVIAGVAGTGKTQLALRVMELIKAKMKEEGRKDIKAGGAAIAHTAKNILANRVQGNFRCYTIASLLSLTKVYSRSGEISFKVGYTMSPPPILDLDIIIIDEASQISEKTRKLINDYRKPNSIVIYLGDWHQTRPVEEIDEAKSKLRDSIVFTLPMVTLTTPFRYEGDIQDLGTAICNVIDSESVNDMNAVLFLKEFIVNSGKDYLFIRSQETFIDKYIEDVKKDNSLYTNIMIGYRKETCKELNSTIRDNHIGNLVNIKTNLDNFYIGEIVKCEQGIQISKNCELFTNEFYKIIDIQERLIYVSYYFTDEEEKEIEIFRTGFTYVEEEGIEVVEIPIYYMTVEDCNGKIINGIWVLKDEKNLNYIYISNKLHRKAKLLLKSKTWSEYYSFNNRFVQFSYGYVGHVHVIQGATYKNVYVNMKDIFQVKPTSIREKLQALYTAITRATSKVIILY